MTINITGNYLEKIEFLPDDFEIDVTKSWALYIADRLQVLEIDYELLNMLKILIDESNIPRERPFSNSVYIPKYIRMTIGNIKRVTGICGDGNLCCVFPYNYNELAHKYLSNKLGIIKVQIELLLIDNEVDETFKLIDSIEDEYLKRLALLYMKVVYNNYTENKIESFRNARKRTLDIINNRL